MFIVLMHGEVHCWLAVMFNCWFIAKTKLLILIYAWRVKFCLAVMPLILAWGCASIFFIDWAVVSRNACWCCGTSFASLSCLVKLMFEWNFFKIEESDRVAKFISWPLSVDAVSFYMLSRTCSWWVASSTSLLILWVLVPFWHLQVILSNFLRIIICMQEQSWSDFSSVVVALIIVFFITRVLENLNLFLMYLAQSSYHF